MKVSLPDTFEREPMMLVGGEWVEAQSGNRFATPNPASGETLATVPEGDAVDVDRAVDAARTAFEGPWSRVKPAERQALLLRLADLVERDAADLSLLDTLDMGAPIKRTGNTRRNVEQIRWYAGQATSIHGETIESSVPGDFVSYTTREPVGVVGAIIPWNGPLGAVIRKVGPVLATGCTLVMKPAEEASLTALRFGRLCQEAGVPDGVVNIVTGPGETAGAALAAHLDVDKIAFTGSHATGRRIIEASAGNLKRLSLELGGKSPNIVFADADLERAVRGAAIAIFSNSGQACSAGSRLFVQRPVYEEFVERLVDHCRGFRVGDGVDPRTDLGPVVSEQQLERVLSYLEGGVAEGAEIVAGGERILDDGLERGYFVPPTILVGVDDGATIAREEIFGPVLTTFAFNEFDEVIERANATRFGLGGAVWSRDVATVHRALRALRAGVVWANCYHTGDPALPFGGRGWSGYGRESGLHHVDDYLDVKAIWIDAGAG